MESAARVPRLLLRLALLGGAHALQDDVHRSPMGCAYRHPTACARKPTQEFLDNWQKKTQCWLCDNGPVVYTGDVLVKEIFSLNLGITADRQITEAWLDTCLSAYVLALFATTRSVRLQTWRFYDFALNILWSCQFEDQVFYDYFGVTATQLHYVFFLLSYTEPLAAHNTELQVAEHRLALAPPFAGTPLIPAQPWDSALVIDVGMGLGADTRYYLSQGFRVASVEANPRSVQTAVSDTYTVPFLSTGQLSFLHAAVSPVGRGGGTTKFFAFSTRPEQSNVEEWLEEQGGEPIFVRSIECADLVRIYGRPVYMKIDIEANSFHCLDSLHHHHRRSLFHVNVSHTPLPKYLSLEVESPGSVGHFQELLLDMGYTAYKVCRQYIYSPAPCEQGAYGTQVPGCGSGPFGERAVDYKRGTRWAKLAELQTDADWIDEFLNGLDWFDLHVSRDD